MIELLKKSGNALAWTTLGLQGCVALVQQVVARNAPALWCTPVNSGGRELLCGIGNASPWYLAGLGIMVLITGFAFICASGAVFLGGVKRHGWVGYALSALVMFGVIIAVVVMSGELNEL
ncbi:MAG TPA: hypothetical protein VIU93_12695 [Gallionellaceae bacterium]